MARKLFRPGLLSLGLLGAAVATAADPAPAPKADPAKAAKGPDMTRKVIRWPGGWMYKDEPGVIYHTDGTKDGKRTTVSGPTTVITDSGNGNNNHIEIDTGGKPGLTVLRNVRNGSNNTIKVTPEGVVIDATPKAPAPRPADKK